MLNPSSTLVNLRQDAKIGVAEKFGAVTGIIADKENLEEMENLSSIRRVDVTSNRNICDSLTLEPSPADKVPKRPGRVILAYEDKEKTAIEDFLIKKD